MQSPDENISRLHDYPIIPDDPGYTPQKRRMKASNASAKAGSKKAAERKAEEARNTP
jgi:hypothetical protein